jgi:hypothetical protein
MSHLNTEALSSLAGSTGGGDPSVPFGNPICQVSWPELGGAAMALLWGLPPTILALRRDLESAVAFHWIQDAARFLAGF